MPDPLTASIAGNDPDSRLASLIDLYLLRCQVEGKSPGTVRAYRETLERFLACAKEEGFAHDPAGVRPENIYSYLGRFTRLSFDTRRQRRLGCNDWTPYDVPTLTGSEMKASGEN